MRKKIGKKREEIMVGPGNFLSRLLNFSLQFGEKIGGKRVGWCNYHFAPHYLTLTFFFPLEITFGI